MSDKVKVVFCDIDYTLSNSKKNEPVRKSVEALRKVRENKVKVILCTSKTRPSVTNLHLDDIPHDGIIHANSGLIYLDGKRKYSDPLSRNTIKELTEFINKNNICAEYVFENESFFNTEELSASAKSYFEEWNDYKPEANKKAIVEKISKGENVYAVMVFLSNDEYEDHIPISTNCFQEKFHNLSLNITNSKSDKGRLVDIMLKLLRINKKSAIAIGDSSSDVPMFESVERSVCVSNGSITAKEAASKVLLDSYDSDAIYNYLRDDEKMFVDEESLSEEERQKLDKLVGDLKNIGDLGMNCFAEYDGAPLSVDEILNSNNGYSNISIMGFDCWKWVGKGNKKSPLYKKLIAKLENLKKYGNESKIRCLLYNPFGPSLVEYTGKKRRIIKQHKKTYLAWLDVAQKYPKQLELRCYNHDPLFSLRAVQDKYIRISMDVVDPNTRNENREAKQDNLILFFEEEKEHPYSKIFTSRFISVFDDEFDEAENISAKILENKIDIKKEKKNINRTFKYLVWPWNSIRKRK